MFCIYTMRIQTTNKYHWVKNFKQHKYSSKHLRSYFLTMCLTLSFSK
uniref:Uncharacterized protein n=1 Tax=Rhizophora mucronata TaxID=61149 RepID=A0A2P2IJT0_RHIMU